MTEIGHFAFSRCKNVTSVVVSEGVTKIGQGAFKMCEKLKSITLPDSISELDDGTFWFSDIEEATYKGKTYKQNQFPNLIKAVNGD